MSQSVTLAPKLDEAIRELLEKGPKRKFNQSIEMIIVFKDIDPKRPEYKLREQVFLPFSPKKDLEVCVVADGDLALQAKSLGVKNVIDKQMLEELGKDKKKARKVARMCDVVLVQTDLMAVTGRVLGPALGPRGKAPLPLPPRVDLGSVLERYKRLAVVRIKDQPQIQVRIGSEANTPEELRENAMAVLNVIENKFKGLSNVSAIYLKKTMGKPVKLKLR
ncbi:MAG: 50S ribosomal protein L1 [Desulfurococcales archaeon]|jgi:large subunit ribosomal protein L1|nr:50S ribosomal protein L1 [Thermoprotei archaeon]NAY90278.1 50S ribosomal protein L1 [Desulfurococcales archaeon]